MSVVGSESLVKLLRTLDPDLCELLDRNPPPSRRLRLRYKLGILFSYLNNVQVAILSNMYFSFNMDLQIHVGH